MTTEFPIETLGNVFAFLLTLAVFSYLIRDNPLYRLAVHAFIGVAAAYITIITLQAVLAPRAMSFIALLMPVFESQTIDWFLVGLQAAPWLLGIFILLKTSPRFAPAGNFALAFLVGVGAALAVGGAIAGTLLGQLQAAWARPTGLEGWAGAVFGFMGTAAVLLYFFYTGKTLPNGRGVRLGFMLPATLAGQLFLMIALAALYVGALAASFALFIERINFIISVVLNFVS